MVQSHPENRLPAGEACGLFSIRPQSVQSSFLGRVAFGVFQEVIAREVVFGERGGTRTLDPMIKSHVLYRLSYALTAALCRGRCGAGQ
jgi:hypothetical protein